MTDSVIIRLFEQRDRERIRQICCDTADRGRPIESFYPYRDIAADLLTGYYTDYEPHSSWVAEYDSQVVGYLNGCLDSARCTRLMTIRVVPATVFKAMLSGVFWKKETWRWFKLALKSWTLGGFSRRISLRKYPAHVHINVDRLFRGKEAGHMLMDNFFLQARQAKARGIHAIVSGDNPNAQRFFEKMGFVVVSRHRMVIPNGKKDSLSYAIVYGKQF